MIRLLVRKISRDGRIGDQVKVALPVADLDVTDPVPLVRQRAQCLRQNLKFLDPNRWFSGLRDKALPFDSEKIADDPAVEKFRPVPAAALSD